MCTIVESQQITGCKRLPIDRCRSDLDARKFSKITNSPFPNSSFSLNYSLLKADLDSTLNFKEIANCVATTPDTSPFEEVMPVPLITDIPPMITEMAASQLGVGDTELFISGNDLMEKVVGDSNGTGGEIPLPGPQQYTPSLTKCEEKPELQNESATASTENAKKEKKSNQILFLEELVINLKHENETLKNEFSQLKERKSKEIECLEIEIDVLNELVAEDAKKRGRQNPMESKVNFKGSLDGVLQDVVVLNKQLLGFLKESRERRAKRELLQKRN